MVTSETGSQSSVKVYVAVANASVVINSLAGETVTPATSLSVLITSTSAASNPLYLISVLIAAAVLTV